MKFISIRNSCTEKLVPSILSGPNEDCSICSKKCIYANIECDISQRTYG